ncbi:MAG: hypothetical protein GX815_14240 [Clostridiales bacterium]|nr:hypothetical protein [Clostridiales bacterium]
MCKYDFECQRCGMDVEVTSEHQNLQDVSLKLASDCPNLDFASQSPIILDAMHEVIASREKSKFAKLLDENSHPGDCSAYNGVIDAIGLSLGRYYELA